MLNTILFSYIHEQKEKKITFFFGGNLQSVMNHTRKIYKNGKKIRKKKRKKTLPPLNKKYKKNKKEDTVWCNC